MTANEIKTLLKLEPHPVEGGYFRRTYTSKLNVEVDREGISTTRAMGTAIYYLLGPGTFSEMHVLSSDELFHFYLGDPVEMLQIAPDGSSKRVLLGPDLAAGQHVQLVVPKNVWQGSRLVKGGSLALLGCSVSPGFEYADYETGRQEALLEMAGEYREMLVGLTRV